MLTKDGNYVYKQEEIETEIIGYFQRIFKTTSNGEVERTKVQIPKKVSREVYNDLLRPYTELDVKETLFQMNPSKARREDGFTTLFYQKY